MSETNISVVVKPEYIQKRGNHHGRLAHEDAQDAANKINVWLGGAGYATAADEHEAQAFLRTAEEQIESCAPEIAAQLTTTATVYIYADMVNGCRVITFADIEEISISVDQCDSLDDVRHYLKDMGDGEGETFERVLEVPVHMVNDMKEEFAFF